MTRANRWFSMGNEARGNQVVGNLPENSPIYHEGARRCRKVTSESSTPDMTNSVPRRKCVRGLSSQLFRRRRTARCLPRAFSPGCCRRSSSTTPNSPIGMCETQRRMPANRPPPSQWHAHPPERIRQGVGTRSRGRLHEWVRHSCETPPGKVGPHTANCRAPNQSPSP